MCSQEKRYGVNPAAPPRPCLFKIICGHFCCRLVVALTKRAEDSLRKRYLKESRVYQQYMEDQEKQMQREQKVSISSPSRPPGSTIFSPNEQKFTQRLREAAGLSGFRLRLRRCQYRVSEGSSPPEPPPYCPHWDNARPKPQKTWRKVGTERLRVYEPGCKSRLERYEERLLDPKSKEARQKAVREAGYSSTTTTLCAGPTNPEAEPVSMFDRLWELEGRSRALGEQSEEHWEEIYWDERSSTAVSTSGARSLEIIELKWKDSTTEFEQCGFDGAARSLAFGRAGDKLLLARPFDSINRHSSTIDGV